MEKLIPMTDFVLKLNHTSNTTDEYAVNAFVKCARYAQFLRQPLTLGMFVPVDDEGNVLEEPVLSDNNVNKIVKYEAAKEKVLFEGFEVDEITSIAVCFIIQGYVRWFDTEDNTFHEYNTRINTVEGIMKLIINPITLTPTALKQIFG